MGRDFLSILQGKAGSWLCNIAYDHPHGRLAWNFDHMQREPGLDRVDEVEDKGPSSPIDTGLSRTRLFKYEKLRFIFVSEPIYQSSKKCIDQNV